MEILSSQDQLLQFRLGIVALSEIPLGTSVHCIEMFPGKGAQIARSAGSSAQILAVEGRYTTLRLRSGEVRKVLSNCKATIGSVSNSEHALRSVGKAGSKRWLGSCLLYTSPRTRD